MTILLLGTNITTGGAQRVLLDLAKDLHARHIPVRAAFFYDKDGLLPEWQKQYEFPIECFNAWSKDGNKVFRILRLVIAWCKLTWWIRNHKISSVLTFTHDSNILGLPAAALAGVPIRYGSHHVRYPSLSKMKILIHKWIINSRIASGLVAVSSFTREQAIEEGVKPSKIKIIHNGIRLPEVRSDKMDALKVEMKDFDDDLLVLTVGRLVAQKGQDIFIESAAAVLEQFPNAHFFIAGDGEQRDNLQALIEKLGVASQVHLLGNRTDIPELLALADVFVLSSRYEGLPMTLLEALASETPVLSSNISGVADVIVHEQTGILVPPENVPALAEGIMHLLSEEPLRMQLAQNGKELVQMRFSLDRMAENYLKILEGKYES